MWETLLATAAIGFVPVKQWIRLFEWATRRLPKLHLLGVAAACMLYGMVEVFGARKAARLAAGFVKDVKSLKRRNRNGR